MKTLKQTLIDRDGITSEEAESLISEASEQPSEYLSEGDMMAAEDICSEYFGLEPDYIFDLM